MVPIVAFDSQIMIWVVIPALKGSAARRAKVALWFIVLFQLAPRLYPLYQQIGESLGRVAETALSGAAYNLLLYMLISHVGFLWTYLPLFQLKLWQSTVFSKKQTLLLIQLAFTGFDAQTTMIF